MERGAGASNLHMRFNLEPITPGNVLLTKKVSGSDDIDFNLVEFPFQIWYKDDETGTEHLLANDEFTTRVSLLAVICTAVLVYSLYQGLIIYIPQKQEQHRFSELQQIAEQENREEKDRTEPSQGDNSRPQNESSSTSAGEAGQQLHFDDIAKINSDFRGWLRIDDTIIDYPVVKSPESDPEYYLHRDFDKNYSFSGTPFIGAGADENSDAFVIYAHKMNNGSMFGTLDDYSHTDWAKQHADIEFDTPDEHRVYRVFAAVQTQVGGEDEFKYYEKTGKLSDKEYNAFVKELRDISVIGIDDCPTNKKQILMLSTCSYHTENGRFVVAAYRI